MQTRSNADENLYSLLQTRIQSTRPGTTLRTHLDQLHLLGSLSVETCFLAIGSCCSQNEGHLMKCVRIAKPLHEIFLVKRKAFCLHKRTSNPISKEVP